MPYLGQRPSKGDENNFKILDDISSYTLTFDGSDSSVVSAANDTITSLNHRFVQGQRVTYNKGGGTVIPGLSDGVYFIIKEDHNTIKLATSASNAANGTAVNITGVGAGSSHTLNVAFDGVNTKFKATHTNGQKAKITRSAQLVISINGVIQQPHDSATPSTGFGFDLDGTIVLSQAPVTGDVYWAHVLTNNNVTFDISDNDIDNFTGNGSTTEFNLSKTPPDNRNILVTVDGVVQYPNDPDGTVRAYNVVENVLTFVTAPDSGVEIQVRHIGFAGSSSGSGGGGGVTNFYGRTGSVVLKNTDNIVANNAEFAGNLTVQGTMTTLDTKVTEVDELEVAANNTTVGVAITQSGSGDILKLYDGSTEIVEVGSTTDSVKITHTGGYGLQVKRGSKFLDLNGDWATSGNAALNAGTSGIRFYYGASSDGIQFNTGTGIDKVRITSDGKVGIGTTNPQEKLHISDPGNPKILIEDTDSSNQVGVRFKTPTQDWTAGLHGGVGYFKISKHSAFGTNDYFTINGSGNVGINSAIPTKKLDINTTGTSGEGILLKATDNTYPAFMGDANRDNYDLFLVAFQGYWNGNRVGEVTVEAGSDTDNKDEGMVKIRTRGDGDSSPQDRLTVFHTGQTKVHSATDSSSTTTGSLVVSGGVGIAKKLFVGSEVGINTTVVPYGHFAVDHGQYGLTRISEYSHLLLQNKNATTTEFWTLAPRDNGRFGIGRGIPASAGQISDEKFTILSDGKVGINTTVPANHLDVIGGNIRVGKTSNGQFLGENNSGLVKVKLDTNGVSYLTGGNFLINATSSVDVASTAASKLQVKHTSGNISAAFYSVVDHDGPSGVLALGHARGSTSGILQDDDTIGQIRFAGGDGNDLETTGAQISAEVDGSPASNNMPSRLVFSTVGGTTGTTLSERFLIRSSGDVQIQVDGTGGTSSQQGVLRFTRTAHSADMKDSRIVFDTSNASNNPDNNTYCSVIAGQRTASNNGSSNLKFYTCFNNSSNYSVIERLTITETGQVVVGAAATAHADTILHVEKTLPSFGETNVKFEGNDTMGARLSLQNNKASGSNLNNQINFCDAGGQSTSAIIGYNTDQTNNYGDLALATRDQSGVPPEARLFIRSDGRTSIGPDATGGPSATLHVREGGNPSSTLGGAPASVMIEATTNANWSSGEAGAELLFKKGGDITGAIRNEHDRGGGAHSYEDAGLAFYTAPSAENPTATRKMRIKSTGDVDIDNGDLNLSDGDLSFASGHGISFAATGDSANNQGSSELLDDYEEGTWTPAFKAGNNSNSSPTTVSEAKYTRIGRMVHAVAYFTMSSYASGTTGGDTRIVGLPYINIGDHGAANVHYWNSLKANVNFMSGTVQGSSYEILIRGTNSASTGTTNLDFDNHFGPSDALIVSATYFTT